MGGAEGLSETGIKQEAEIVIPEQEGNNTNFSIKDENLEEVLQRLEEETLLMHHPLLTLIGEDKLQDILGRILVHNQKLQKRSLSIDSLRKKIQKYEPGRWLVEAGGIAKDNYDIPKVTTLLVIGTRGAGKSTLINNMIRVVNNKSDGFDRAQMGDGQGHGSYFLQEHLVCDKHQGVRAFDSRGLLLSNISEDLELVKSWMMEGICHGMPVSSKLDSSVVKEILQARGRQGHSQLSSQRQVNFVIFVVNAVEIREIMWRRSQNMASGLVDPMEDALAKFYKCPFISYKDDSPAVVMTHGDQFSLGERLRIMVYIGQIFGISPVHQVFDIPLYTGRYMDLGEGNLQADFALLDMMKYTLERADRNLSYKLNNVEQFLGDLLDRKMILTYGHKAALFLILVSWVICLISLIIIEWPLHSKFAKMKYKL